MTIENLAYLIGGILVGNVIAVGIAWWHDLCQRPGKSPSGGYVMRSDLEDELRKALIGRDSENSSK